MRQREKGGVLESQQRTQPTPRKGLELKWCLEWSQVDQGLRHLYPPPTFPYRAAIGRGLPTRKEGDLGWGSPKAIPREGWQLGDSHWGKEQFSAVRAGQLSISCTKRLPTLYHPYYYFFFCIELYCLLNAFTQPNPLNPDSNPGKGELLQVTFASICKVSPGGSQN